MAMLNTFRLGRVAAAAAGLLFVGCGGKGDTGDSAVPGTDTNSETDTHTGTMPTTDGVSPVIITGTVYCQNTGGTSNVDTWYAEVAAEDPQGPDDLLSFGSLLSAYTKQGDAQVYTDASLVCGADGACFGSVTGDVSGIPCASASDFYWTAEVLDDDGNSSGEVQLTKTAGP